MLMCIFVQFCADNFENVSWGTQIEGIVSSWFRRVSNKYQLRSIQREVLEQFSSAFVLIYELIL